MRPRVAALVAAMGLVAASCTGGESDGGRGRPEVEPGGTLRLGLVEDFAARLHPQREAAAAAWELYRCCLLRTLLSYSGRPAAGGGAELRPDLAASMPTVSGDLRTWTFRLRQGITYAPPFQDTELVAEDVIRAIERLGAARGTRGHASHYAVIEGYRDYVTGEAREIRGLRASDDATLVVRLSRPVGDLGYRMSLPATAPIPPGASRGHRADYGRFLVATGPYMVAGSPALDFGDPPERQEPLSGYRPGRSLVLVRNPSWDRDRDRLRAAYPDRIEVTIGRGPEAYARMVDADELDLQLDGVPPLPQVRKYRTDPQLRGRIFEHGSGTVRYVGLNVAQPPFDDVHVRRAVNLAIDKEALRSGAGGPAIGEVAGHVFPPGTLHGELAGYDPYRTPGDRGDVRAARREMARSEHDTDGDGMCDERACEGVLVVAGAAQQEQAARVREAIEAIGISAKATTARSADVYEDLTAPGEHIGMGVASWGADFPDAGAIARPMFLPEALGPRGCCNMTMLGAGRTLLQRAGYDVRSVPTVAGRVRACDRTTGQGRPRCWAALDRHLMERVVPWAPFMFETNVDVVSGDVRGYAFDQFTGLAAVDRIAVAVEPG